MGKFLKSIKIKEISYKVYENETSYLPYLLIDENGNRYFIFKKTENVANYVLITPRFKTKLEITKEEFDKKLNEKLEVDWSSVSFGGLVGFPTNIPHPFIP